MQSHVRFPLWINEYFIDHCPALYSMLKKVYSKIAYIYIITLNKLFTKNPDFASVTLQYLGFCTCTCNSYQSLNK